MSASSLGCAVSRFSPAVGVESRFECEVNDFLFLSCGRLVPSCGLPSISSHLKGVTEGFDLVVGPVLIPCALLLSFDSFVSFFMVELPCLTVGLTTLPCGLLIFFSVFGFPSTCKYEEISLELVVESTWLCLFTLLERARGTERAILLDLVIIGLRVVDWLSDLCRASDDADVDLSRELAGPRLEAFINGRPLSECMSLTVVVLVV